MKPTAPRKSKNARSSKPSKGASQRSAPAEAATTAVKPSTPALSFVTEPAASSGSESSKSEKGKVGRPTIRSQELGTQICALIAEGLSLREICKMDGMPSRTAVLEWLAADAAFAGQYAQAREDQTETLADELLEIADDGSNDWMLRENKDGSAGWVVNGEHIQRSRLRVDTRKWIMSKLRPKKYGDKLEHEHSGPGGGGIPVSIAVRFVDGKDR